MHFQLPQFQKMSQHLSTLQSDMKNLQQQLEQAKSSQSKVNNALQKTIQKIYDECSNTFSQLHSIENDVEDGLMIPQEIDIDFLIVDKSLLPEWFDYVFKKEFLKAKKNFDLLAKKNYKFQGLKESKNQLKKDIQSFETLYQRFKKLNSQDKQSMNILSKLQFVKNKTQLLKEKFFIFCQLITSKIMNFLEESLSKALNYSNQMSHCSGLASIQPSTIAFGIHQRNPILPYPQIPHQRSFLKSSMPLASTNYSGGRSSSSLNHNPSIRSIVYDSGYLNGLGNANGIYGGFNYRGYGPKWMNTSQHDYYH